MGTGFLNGAVCPGCSFPLCGSCLWGSWRSYQRSPPCKCTEPPVLPRWFIATTAKKRSTLLAPPDMSAQSTPNLITAAPSSSATPSPGLDGRPASLPPSLQQPSRFDRYLEQALVRGLNWLDRHLDGQRPQSPSNAVGNQPTTSNRSPHATG